MNQIITAGAFIHKDNKVLLIKRSSTEAFAPNHWELPGGHIEYGETIEDGLKREAKEEIGIEITVYDSVFSFTYVLENTASHYVEIINMAVPKNSDSKIILNPKEHSEYKWISKLHELEDLEMFHLEAAAVTKGFEVMGWQ